MKETITKIIKLFDRKWFEYQEVRVTEPKYVETNVTDNLVLKLQERNARDKEMLAEGVAIDKLTRKAK